MELLPTLASGARVLRGSGSVTLTEGQTLKVETTPMGEETLDAAVPAGKEWLVNVIVDVVESNAP